MKLKRTLLTWALAPIVAVTACDSGPCEETRSCGEWTDSMGGGGSAGSASGGRANGGNSNGGTTGRGGAVASAGEAGAQVGGSAGASIGAGGQPEGGRESAQGGAESGGGEAGNGGVGGSAPTCDLSQSPSAESCLVSDQYALFVAPTGSDQAAGTQAEPFRTMAKALEMAVSTGKLVIACNASFDEGISLSAGARVYGGFACPSQTMGWVYRPGTRSKFAPLLAGPALSIQTAKQPVILEDLEFQAQNATASGSSIAASVVRSPNVTLRRTKLVAGKGAAGTDGVNGAAGADADLPVSDQRGGDAVCGEQAPSTRDGGRWLAASTCGSRGGSGGQAQKGDLGFPGASGSPQTNVTPEGVNNRGSEAPTTPANAPGGDGKAGSPGKAGGAGGATLDQSTFTDKGFTPSAAGGSGTNGFPGQGGGGGAASNGADVCIGASGGAGGLGGCGGKGASGGGGGGASVALLAWESGITLDACELTSQSGGAGGKGGDGGAGGAGKLGAEGGLGLTDSSHSVGPGGKGGRGGDGGSGGPGAGGNGGPSYALVFHGTPPAKLNDTTLTASSGGVAGPGGAAGAVHAASGSVGNAGQQLNVP